LGILARNVGLAQQAAPDLPSDIPAKLQPAEQEFDFTKRDIMLPCPSPPHALRS
jgi:hypothetical protein